MAIYIFQVVINCEIASLRSQSSQPTVVATFEEANPTLQDDTSVTVEEIADPALMEGLIDNNLTIELDPENE